MFVKDIAARIAAKKPTLFRRVIVFAGSFDPFAIHHREIVEQLVELKYWMTNLDLEVPVDIVIWPIGVYETKKQNASAEDRKAMLDCGLEGLDVTVRMDDLEHDEFGYTSTYQMQDCLSSESRNELREEYFVRRHHPVALAEVWHVIGTDNVRDIKQWNEGYRLWQHARFIVIARPGCAVATLPPKSMLLEMGTPRNASCTNIRQLIAAKKPWEHLVPGTVAAYIKAYGLYQPNSKTKRSTP